jgi:hypothetical protein
LLGGVGLTVATLIIVLIRKDRLHVNHGLGWILVAIAFAFLGFAPSIIDWVALELGVAYPPTLALTGAISVLVIKILVMDIERSHMEMRNQRLIQRLGMLEADLGELKRSAGSQLIEENRQSTANGD